MENIAVTIAGVLGNLGSSVLVALVMFILGVCFKAGFSKSLRGGLYAGIGLAGLSVIINASTEVLTPAIQAFAENFASEMTVTDVGWGSSGIAFAWPGLAFVILGTLVINVLMIVLKLTKTMWTDIWSIWHGNVLGGMVWALTGNVTLGVLAGVIFLSLGAVVADWTAKDYQEFNGMPGISVPCTTSFLALFAKPFNWIIEKIPGVNKINASPENIRKRMGIFGELGVMGTVIGCVIGILAQYSYGAVLQLGISIGVLMVFLPGNKMLPIASLAIVPYWCGAVAPQLKGNVFRIVLFVLLWTIPIFLIASAQAPLHTLTMGNLGLADPAVVNSSFDMGGDPLGALLIWIFGLFQ